MTPDIAGWLLLVPSLLCAALPMTAFTTAIWWLDHHERDPVGLVALTFVWGGTGAILTGILGSMGLIAAAEWMDCHAAATGTVLIAPLAEEPAKALALALVARSRHFDGPADGFVYGAAAGFGFGMTENFMYFVSVAFGGDLGVWAQTVFVRTLYSGVMHGTASALAGAAIGLTRFQRPSLRVAGALGGLSAAVALHALWNGLIALHEAQGPGSIAQGVNLLLLPCEVACVLALFAASIAHEGRLIQAELGTEPTSPVADGPRARRVALRLGLRKHQTRHSEDPYLRQDRERLRRDLHCLHRRRNRITPLASTPHLG